MANETWIEWEGGEMPVDPRDYVEVIYGDGMNWDGEAREFDWTARQNGIAQYRVIPESYRIAQQMLDGEAQ